MAVSLPMDLSTICGNPTPTSSNGCNGCTNRNGTINAKRKSYDMSFKLKVVEEAEVTSNRATARKYNIDEKTVREWRLKKEELCALQQSGGGKKRMRLEGGGRKPLLGCVEEDLATWIIYQRQNGMRVTYKMIVAKAVELNKLIDDNVEFKGSRGWIFNFMRRWNFILRRQSNVNAGSATDCPVRVTDFLCYTRFLQVHNNVLPGLIGNMDEVTVWHDDTVSSGSASERQRLTVVLSAMADGKKLPPVVVFKTTQLRESSLRSPPGAFVTVSRNGWIQEETLVEWIRLCWSSAMDSCRILIWDAYRCHLLPQIREMLQKLKTEVSVVPKGCTKYLQPAVVSWIQPFQQSFRNRSSNWAGSASNEQLVEWVKEAWNEVSEDVIRSSFRSCGIALNPDGSEDCEMTLGNEPELVQSVKELLQTSASNVVLFEDEDEEEDPQQMEDVDEKEMEKREVPK